MAHYWEVPGFSTGPGYPTLHFDNEVLGFIENGLGATSNAPRSPALKRNADLANANVYILTIRRGKDATSANYPAKIEQIKEKVTAVLRNPEIQGSYYPRPNDGD